MLLFPESHYDEDIRKKSQSHHQESKIKELLSFSVGEAIKQKKEKPTNLTQDYNDNQYLANKNKQSYLQSNIFHDTKIQIRNDKQTLTINQVKNKQPSSRIQTEPQKQPSVRGTLNQEYRKDDIKANNQHTQESVLFSTLSKYYKDYKPEKKPNLISANQQFLQHDSVRDKKLEQQEKQLEAEYQSQKAKDAKCYSSLNQSRRQSKEINVKLNDVEIPKQERIGFDITIQQKGNGFLPSQFNSIIKHNGFYIQKKENDNYVIQPFGVNHNIHSIVKYLKDYDNKSVVKKIPYQQMGKK